MSGGAFFSTLTTLDDFTDFVEFRVFAELTAFVAVGVFFLIVFSTSVLSSSRASGTGSS